jgi:hypothetical protein
MAEEWKFSVDDVSDSAESVGTGGVVTIVFIWSSVIAWPLIWATVSWGRQEYPSIFSGQGAGIEPTIWAVWAAVLLIAVVMTTLSALSDIQRKEER